MGSMETKSKADMGGMAEESALNKFRQLDLKGSTKDDTKLHSVHQNTISTLRVFEESGGTTTKLSCKSLPLHFFNVFVLGGSMLISSFLASGVDGRVVIWNV